MENKKLTGYPSIDKPWLKYYTEEAANAKLPECSIYEYLLQNNEDNLNNTSIVYMGRKITFKNLFNSIENVAKAFKKIGIKKGDIVACISPSFPEVVYSFYAANKLGATSDYFDPRTEPQIVYDELVSTNSKVMLIFEDFIPRFKEVIEKAQIPNVIVVSAKDSLPFPIKTLANLKKNTIPQTYTPFAEMVKESKNDSPVKTVSNIGDEIALMEHTGGTTGVPKAVCLTNINVNSISFQVREGGNDTSRKNKYLAIAFPFTAYGLIGSQHDPLIYGMPTYLCFSMDIKEIAKTAVKNKINNMSNTPVVWDGMMGLLKNSKVDLSFLKNAIVGADTLDSEKEKEINEFLLNHNNPVKLKKGYGMTELASAVSLTFSNESNKIGSVGIPFTHTVISIFDTETGEELKYNERGEICICGPSVMKGYYNNPEETDKVLKTHKDGKVWMHSGDIGHIDEDGFLFIDGRLKRMIINHHGFKIFAPEIEKAISKHNGVDKCCVVGIPDKEYETGQIAVAFIIKKENTVILEEELKKICEDNLPNYYMPSKFIFTDSFPYTSAAKVDYRKLECVCQVKMLAKGPQKC